MPIRTQGNAEGAATHDDELRLRRSNVLFGLRGLDAPTLSVVARALSRELHRLYDDVPKSDAVVALIEDLDSFLRLWDG